MSKKKSEVILPSEKDEKKAKNKRKADKKAVVIKTPKNNKKDKKENKEKAPKASKKSLYTNFMYRRKAKKDAEARRKAEELAALPKDPVKRFFARLHPRRVFKWWFSWRGQKAILKFFAACFLLLVIFIGGLFLYYKKDLDEIRLDEMTISETVNTYLDRNGVVLWKDTGDEDYRLVVDGSEISDYMRWATVAIEDRNFYNHPGVDFMALIRATFSTLTGQGVQGGSTLTQQLIKQVYFSDEAASESRGGLARKIKELILSIELERMYDKEQIITMYLNQSPYGGRRNGVESAAQTYFGKSAKDLTLAESALLASIPNNPGVLNPYNTYGNEALLERQHKTLDVMAQMGYISQEEAEEAKAVPILDTIKPEASQYSDMIAPHFVLEVRSQLEKKYGISTMRAGGWTITTTLDARAQRIAEDAVRVGQQHTYKNHSDDIALVSVDVETSQVIAMVGSIDFYNVNYGEVNATVDSLIEPGSTIKPILDYTPLFMQRDGINYGPGTILKDENIDSIYCAGYRGSCTLANYARKYFGDVTIRFSLGNSLNIGAVKALYLNGVENSLEIAHALGDKSYCADTEATYGLSIAIGSGCGVRMVEHANAYASLARGGAYKDLAYVLEVKNSSGDVIESWTDTPAVQVVDPQIAYLITNILSDRGARPWNGPGFVVPGVWTGTKTGTTTTSNSSVTKDSMMESFSTAVSTFVWNGNHDGSGVTSSTHDVAAYTAGHYMERVHKEVYEPDGRWHYGDQPARPAGIKTLTVNGVTDIWPSWFDPNKNSGVSKDKLTFNRYNKLLAAECTPDAYKIEIEVTKIIDPVTKKESFKDIEPYNNEVSDTCDYVPPTVSLSVEGDGNFYATINKGSSKIAGYTLTVDGTDYSSILVSSNGLITGYTVTGKEKNVKFTLTDEAGYVAASELTLTPAKDETDDKKPEKTEPKVEDKTEKPEQTEKTEDKKPESTEKTEQVEKTDSSDADASTSEE